MDLSTDPPPDLSVEVGISNPSGRRIEIYKQLGVPEIWRYSGGTVAIHRLQEGEYVPCDTSLAFPMVSIGNINHFFQQAATQADTSFIRAWQRWIRQPIDAESA